MGNYQQTLELVENFLKVSGIKDFCQQVCRGACCQPCPDNKDGCRQIGMPRLGCSLHLCIELKMAIFSGSQRSFWNSLCIGIHILLAQNSVKDLYFNPYPPEIATAFQIKAGRFPDLSQLDLPKLNYEIKKLITALHYKCYADYDPFQAKMLNLLQLKICERSHVLQLQEARSFTQLNLEHQKSPAN